jgi:hypothetical protein
MKTEPRQDKTVRATAAGKENAEQMMGLSQSLLAKAMTSPQKLVEANLATGSEIFSFMSKRFQAQAEFWTKLANCHAPDEALGVQRDFAAGLTKDYSAEVTHLAEMTAGLAQENFRNFAEETTDVMEKASKAPETAKETIAEVA